FVRRSLVRPAGFRGTQLSLLSSLSHLYVLSTTPYYRQTRLSIQISSDRELHPNKRICLQVGGQQLPLGLRHQYIVDNNKEVPIHKDDFGFLHEHALYSSHGVALLYPLSTRAFHQIHSHTSLRT